ncbi:MAG TPA: TIGR03905 family TSCPD domain-containing protein [Candidatus Ventrousia excrementavium]|uniref:ribonucleoside-diphosphate reductase n=1 Tax=Candidatus Ventrousia excrementavium TaxID=2840961 RepID=A0A9D1LL42_9CLOT|nr:TIGR03905 family TSCPD domain-containing protein [Candidatus Ventrousia excrementavium]
MVKEITYRPQGVCSRAYHIVASDGVIDSIDIVGGCDGNLKGIASLLRGMKIEDAIERMSGVTCGSKPTSCPDQIARALRQLQQGQQ